MWVACLAQGLPEEVDLERCVQRSWQLWWKLMEPSNPKMIVSWIHQLQYGLVFSSQSAVAVPEVTPASMVRGWLPPCPCWKLGGRSGAQNALARPELYVHHVLGLALQFNHNCDQCLIDPPKRPWHVIECLCSENKSLICACLLQQHAQVSRNKLRQDDQIPSDQIPGSRKPADALWAVGQTWCIVFWPNAGVSSFSCRIPPPYVASHTTG